VSDEDLNLVKRPGKDVDPLTKTPGRTNQAFSDEALVDRARRDDRWAIEQLIGRYQQKVFRVAYQMCYADEEAAKDRVQEAFFRAFRNIKRFKGNSSFYTWLYRIVVNTCIDAQRRRKRRRQTFIPWRFGKTTNEESNTSLEDYPDSEENSNPLARLTGQQLEIDVKKALKSLSEKQRVAFQLKVFQEMSISEIAEIMDLAEGTVKTHLFRATQFIQNQLRQWVEN
jgi:RNA polymerase sigma-70 factor (ECF subfamily)